jgi:hypothetical protein
MLLWSKGGGRRECEEMIFNVSTPKGKIKPMGRCEEIDAQRADPSIIMVIRKSPPIAVP